MQWRRLVAVTAVVALLFVGFLTLRREMGIEFSPESLRDAVAGMGIWAPIFYVTLVAFRVPLGMPSQVVLLGGGLVFGAVQGTLYGAVGLVVSAVVLFLGSRWAGRESIEARLPKRLRPLFDVASSPGGVAFIAVGTGYPFGPVSMYHLMAGLTAMSLLAFALAAAAGSIVRSATFTFFGSTLVSGEWGQVLQGVMILSLALVVPLLFRGPRSWLRQALGQSGPSSPLDQSRESRR